MLINLYFVKFLIPGTVQYSCAVQVRVRTVRTTLCTVHSTIKNVHNCNMHTAWLFMYGLRYIHSVIGTSY